MTHDTRASDAERHRFGWWGWLGLAMMIAGGLGVIVTGWRPLRLYFTPWMWSGYLLSADALLRQRQGTSWLFPHPGRFLLLLGLSLPLWLIFEVYNLHLQNWAYVGLPDSLPLRLLGYTWSFVTIWPALFLTADLLESFGLNLEGRPLTVTLRRRRIWILAGALMAGVPLLLPAQIAAYTFAIVWVAWVPLLEPFLLDRAPVTTLLGQARAGLWTRWVSLAAGGLFCGLLWESWNMAAEARWIYIFPMFQNLKIFEMPAPGFLGFIPFAWEAASLYAFSSLILVRLFPRLRSRSWWPLPEQETFAPDRG